MPIGSWLRGPLLPLARDLFDGLRTTGWFAAHELDRLLHEHVASTVDHRKRIWTLMVLELWRRQHRL